MTTIHDIAKKTGFSVCTISQVLNGHPKAMKMRRTTVETILAAAKELNYTPSFAARTLATGRSCTVGLILGDIQDDVFSYFHEKFIESARAAGCRLLTLVTDWNREQELAGIRELRARGCDGIFLGVGSLSADPVFCARLAEERYPIISYGTALEGISSVIVDYRPGIEDMLSYSAVPPMPCGPFPCCIVRELPFRNMQILSESAWNDGANISFRRFRRCPSRSMA